MAKEHRITVDFDGWLELGNIADGTFAPLKGFMDERAYRAVVDEMRLPTGEPWTIPITLAVDERVTKSLGSGDSVVCTDADGEAVGLVEVCDVFRVDARKDSISLYGTDSTAHPGVRRELERSPFRVAGRSKLLRQVPHPFPEYALSPAETRELFAGKGWSTVVGFQTRNPPHRAHEYLQRVALEQVDGLFLQPLIGWKKAGDFTPEAVMRGYECQLKGFYPERRVVLGSLMTPMRYAGPREAVFHALVRRNHGCTHFIVGRDHAGVGGFYTKYQSQEIFSTLPDLGIRIMPLKGPYFCRSCGGIATEKTCPHGEDEVANISGTQIRALLTSGTMPPQEIMRPEVSQVLLDLAARGALFGDGG